MSFGQIQGERFARWNLNASNSLSLQVIVMACREFEMGRVSCNWQCAMGEMLTVTVFKRNIFINHILLASEWWGNASCMTFSSTSFFILSSHPIKSFDTITVLPCTQRIHFHSVDRGEQLRLNAAFPLSFRKNVSATGRSQSMMCLCVSPLPYTM